LPQIDILTDRDTQALATLWRREMLHTWRDKGRLIGSIVQPVIYLLIIGNGMSPAVGQMAGGIDFKKFMFPGVICMAVLFSSIFYGITVVADREFGFLKEILVAPVRRYVVAMGKILAGSTISVAQAFIVLMLGPLLADVSLSLAMVLKLAPCVFLLAVLTTSLGVALGTVMKSMQAFQIVMTLLVLPLFFLSGGIFPLKNLPTWMEVLSKIDPLTYGVDLIRQIGLTTTLRSHGIQAFAVHSIGFDILMLLGFTAFMIFLAIDNFRRL
jgi:ABC-2 type transport system permease protein